MENDAETCVICGEKCEQIAIWERRILCSDVCRIEAIRRLKWLTKSPESGR